jgi:predicted pyridoxine 5'-phosphate oxidase superfamily flavin-nucleotide-binding protein
MKAFAEIAFTPAVRELQERDSRGAYARMQDGGYFGEGPGLSQGLGPDEMAFLAAADHFYMATVSESGWPYVQHRGGPRGFLKVLSPTRLAFADFRGNRQHVSEGNAARDDRVALIVMDYVNRRRLKLFGRLRFEPLAAVQPQQVADVDLPDYRARIERVATLEVEAFDWNCPQHITQRFTLAEIEDASRPLRERIAQLEAENEALRVQAGKL